MKWQVTGAKDAPADYLGGGGQKKKKEGERGGWRGDGGVKLRRRAGAGELVENRIGI